jgi:hypothetical protein
VFSKVFLVQIRQKFREICFEVRIQDKNNFGKRVPKFKIRGKKENSGEENFSIGPNLRLVLFLFIYLFIMLHIFNGFLIFN